MDELKLIPRAAPILLSVLLSVSIPAFLMVSELVKYVCYTSTNSVVCLLLTMNTVFSKFSK